MTKTQVEVIASVERRRRWSRAEKEWIVAAALEPGAVASAVAREAGIQASQLYRWRQELCGPARAAPGFAAVTIAEPKGTPSPFADDVGPDRDRVYDRSAAADQRRCGCGDGLGCDRSSDRQAAVTIPIRFCTNTRHPHGLLSHASPLLPLLGLSVVCRLQKLARGRSQP